MPISTTLDPWGSSEQSGLDPSEKTHHTATTFETIPHEAQSLLKQQTPTLVKAQPTSLPKDWVQKYDQRTGRVYYGNTITGHTQWEPPE